MKHIFLKEKKIVFESNYHVGDKSIYIRKKRKLHKRKRIGALNGWMLRDGKRGYYGYFANKENTQFMW